MTRVNLYFSCLLLLIGLATSRAHAHHHELNYLIVDKRSAPFQLVEQQQSSGGIITRIVEEIVSVTDLQLRHVVSTRKRNKLLKKQLETPWITYSAKVWQPDLSRARFIDVPLFDVRHSLVTCHAGFSSVAAPIDLHTRRLAILKNFDYPELKHLANNNLISLLEVNGYEQGFMMAKHKRVDGFVEMSMRLQYHMDQTGDNTSCFHLVDLSSLIAPFPIYLVVSDKLSDRDFDAMSAYLLTMKNSGRIAELLEEYLRPGE